MISSLQCLKQFLRCKFQEFGNRSANNPLIDFFGCYPHLSAWYCIDNVRRNFLLVTNRVSGLKSTPSTTYLSIPFSLQFKISLRLLRTSSWANNCYKCQDMYELYNSPPSKLSGTDSSSLVPFTSTVSMTVSSTNTNK